MGPHEKHQYLEAIRSRYYQAGKREKKTILDEFCFVCEYNRKYAIRVLRPSLAKLYKLRVPRIGRPIEYNDPVIFDVLKNIWQMLNLPCSTRLKAALPLWLPHYATFYKSIVTEKQMTLLLRVSPSTIDRLLAPLRVSSHKWGLCTTKPGSLLKKHIPIATDQWDESRPGFLEADSVSHCGMSTDGTYVISINCIDLATTWREQRAVFGKGERGVLGAIRDVEDKLPFDLLGFDCDNGSEFLNWHIHRHLTDRKRPVKYTRSRPYHKNDNAHVEEKNWTLIRQYIGYQRLAQPHLADELNALYTSEWRLMMNFFVPSTKLVEKRRIGSRIVKRYDAPKTPYQRVLEHPAVTPEAKLLLTNQFLTSNPFVLQKAIQKKIKHLVLQAEPLPHYIQKEVMK
ncbi:MAG: integrase [Parcubacteria group bacterium]